MDIRLISDKICYYSKAKNMSVEQLAEAIGKSPRQVNRYRNGQCKHISLDTLLLIAEALEIDPREFLH